MGWRTNRNKEGYEPDAGVYIQDEGDGVYNVGQTNDYHARYSKAERKGTVAFIPVSNSRNRKYVEQDMMDSVQARGGELRRPGRAKHSRNYY